MRFNSHLLGQDNELWRSPVVAMGGAPSGPGTPVYGDRHRGHSAYNAAQRTLPSLSDGLIAPHLASRWAPGHPLVHALSYAGMDSSVRRCLS